MKKGIALILVIVSVLTLCACGQKSDVDIIRECIQAYKEESGLGNENITIVNAGFWVVNDEDKKIAVVEYIKGTKTTVVAIDTKTHEYTTEFGYNGLAMYRMFYLTMDSPLEKFPLSREEVSELN